MLQGIHQALKGWVTKLIVIVIALSFTLWGVQTLFDRGQNKTILQVGKFKLTTQQLRIRLQHLDDFIDQQLAAKRPTSVEKLAGWVLRELIQERVLDNLVNRAQLGFGKQEAEQLIRYVTQLRPQPRVPEQTQNNMNDKVNRDDSYAQWQTWQLTGWRLAWQRQPLPPTAIALGGANRDQSLTDDLARRHLVYMLMHSNFTLPLEQQHLNQVRTQRRDFDFIKLTRMQLEHPERITNSEIEEYYHQSADRLALPAKLRLAKLVISREFWRRQLTQNPSLKQEYQKELDRAEAAYQANAAKTAAASTKAAHAAMDTADDAGLSDNAQLLNSTADIDRTSKIIAIAERNAIARLAENILRELRYNANAYQEVANSYGLTWQLLPWIEEYPIVPDGTKSVTAADELPLIDMTSDIANRPAVTTINDSRDNHRYSTLFFKHILARGHGIQSNSAANASYGNLQNVGWLFYSPLTWQHDISLVAKLEVVEGGAVILWPVEWQVRQTASLAQAKPTILRRLARRHAQAQLASVAKQIAASWQHESLPATMVRDWQLQIHHRQDATYSRQRSDVQPTGSVGNIDETDIDETTLTTQKLAFEQCSLLDPAEQVALRCQPDKCWIVKLNRIHYASSKMDKSDSSGSATAYTSNELPLPDTTTANLACLMDHWPISFEQMLYSGLYPDKQHGVHIRYKDSKWAQIIDRLELPRDEVNR